MKRLMNLSIAILLLAISTFANSEVDSVKAKCNIVPETFQQVFQTAIVTGKMDIGSLPLFVTLGSNCMTLVHEEFQHRNAEKIQ